MEIFRGKNVFVSLFLSLIAGLLVIFSWEFVLRMSLYINNYLSVEKIKLNWWSFLLMVLVALVMGFLTEKFSVKRILKFVIPFTVIWAILSFTAATYYSVNLFFIRITSVIFLP